MEELIESIRTWKHCICCKLEFGLYGGVDNRINVGIPATETEMKRLAKRYYVHIYEGASHASLKNQSGQNGAKLKATEKAWPVNLAFFRELL